MKSMPANTQLLPKAVGAAQRDQTERVSHSPSSDLFVGFVDYIKQIDRIHRPTLPHSSSSTKADGGKG